jgi:hypothetical protein
MNGTIEDKLLRKIFLEYIDKTSHKDNVNLKKFVTEAKPEILWKVFKEQSEQQMGIAGEHDIKIEEKVNKMVKIEII